MQRIKTLLKKILPKRPAEEVKKRSLTVQDLLNRAANRQVGRARFLYKQVEMVAQVPAVDSAPLLAYLRDVLDIPCNSSSEASASAARLKGENSRRALAIMTYHSSAMLEVAMPLSIYSRGAARLVAVLNALRSIPQ